MRFRCVEKKNRMITNVQIWMTMKMRKRKNKENDDEDDGGGEFNNDHPLYVLLDDDA